MLTEKDLTQISSLGIAESQVLTQLHDFQEGFPFLDVVRAADVEDGILTIDLEMQAKLRTYWLNYLKQSGNVVKFVPASGAASRMFKDLYTFRDSTETVPEGASVIRFFEDIESFAFFSVLDGYCMEIHGYDVAGLISQKRYKDILSILLDEKGMNYGKLPKGLLVFHKYPHELRTPFLEHLVEGALYCNSRKRGASLHFTVSPEHMELFKNHYRHEALRYGNRFGVQYNVTFSTQKSSTNTIAVDAENKPFRDDNGNLIFRPAGHGALIDNLNDLEGDVVFIKNIDNVVPDRLKDITVDYKIILGGMLVSIQRQVFAYLEELDDANVSEAKLHVIRRFCESKLAMYCNHLKLMDREDLIDCLHETLNRPIRVCGMVRNEGEPGGGPFWVRRADGLISLQILEKAQLNLEDPKVEEMMKESAYFNPVDLACGIRNYKGEKFNLHKYVDKNTGFISEKSYNGRTLKALELPGLWNGAMSNWITLFVEVPIETFNPVKSVNDLLRVQHQ